LTPQPELILDASALLAYLFDEPGAERVVTFLQQTCAISAVNFAEVLSKISDHGVPASQAADLMTSRGLTGTVLQVWPFDETQARELAQLRARLRRSGLGLADLACLALAGCLNLPVATADRLWADLHTGIKVNCIR
jgi:ribonuclease VapC